MEEKIRQEIVRFVAESPSARFPAGSCYFEVPLVGFAAASDPLFAEFQNIIGPFHQRPEELLAGAATVICWILPVARNTRQCNARVRDFPAKEWALTRTHGEACNGALRRHLAAWLEAHGEAATIPQYAASWKEFADTPVGIASTWSERHAAYAAGLGTFSLNDGLITEKGIAHRCGSVITTLALPPSQRSYVQPRAHCLYHHNGSCGACIGRCPVGALSRLGHDKERCRDFVYGTAPAALSARYGVPQTGCGLCQTRVPCESRNPVD
jgi:epoxyqueuosine reductase QueG